MQTTSNERACGSGGGWMSRRTEDSVCTTAPQSWWLKGHTGCTCVRFTPVWLPGHPGCTCMRTGSPTEGHTAAQQALQDQDPSLLCHMHGTHACTRPPKPKPPSPHAPQTPSRYYQPCVVSIPSPHAWHTCIHHAYVASAPAGQPHLGLAGGGKHKVILVDCCATVLELA
jgi:hypothetical protein